MKAKFNPKDVPSWVRWIAVDENGECFGFRRKPEIGNHYHRGGYWDCSDWSKCTDIDFVTLYISKPPKNWKDELYTWGY